METWQIILIYTAGVVVSAIVGSILAVFVFYLMARFIFKETIDLTSLFRILYSLTTISNKTHEAYLRIKELRRTKPVETQVTPEPIIKEQFTQPQDPVVEEQFTQRPIPRVETQPAPVQIVPEPSLPIEEVDHSLREIVPELLIEFEHNLQIAGEYSGSNLLSLQTNIWDTNQPAINNLPVKMQTELASLYATIKILNSLVWFSSEFQRQSNSLEEQYSSLLNIIVRKINELTTFSSPYFKGVPTDSDPSKVPIA